MSFRGGLGPVYAFEWLTATRRWQMYAARSLFVAALLVGLALCWSNHAHRLRRPNLKQQAAAGRAFYQSLVSIELLMVLLAAPAATAGAICLDKARGTLMHVLVTDLSDSEIVLGKLAARLVPVLGLVASSLPVMALATLLGGIDPVALTGSFVVLLGLAVLACTLALALSVWGRKTHEVLLATYLVLVIWVGIVPFCFLDARRLPQPWVLRTNPFILTVLAHEPSLPGAPGFGQQVVFCAGALAVSAAIVVITVVRLRPVIIGQFGRSERRWAETIVGRCAGLRVGRRRAEWLGPALDTNPVLWREWHRRRLTRWSATIWGIYFALAVGFGVLAFVSVLHQNTRSMHDFAVFVNCVQVTVGLLLVSVTSATSLGEERARGSLDILLATPLPTTTIVWGKWWGAYRGIFPLALLPAVVAGALAVHSGRWAGPFLILGLVLAYGAGLNSLGLLLATWIRQVGRTLGLCVATYVAVTVGFVVLVVSIWPSGPGPTMFPIAIMMGSPPVGIGALSAGIDSASNREWTTSLLGALFWIPEYATVAGVLFVATLLTFERCLGRIPDRSIARDMVTPSRTKLRKPSAVLAEELA